MNLNQVIRFFLKYLKEFYIDFNQAVIICFKKYLIFKGRANRAEYWYWTLFKLIIAYASFRLDYRLEHIFTEKYSGSFSKFIFFVTFLPGISVSVRRLHDIDKSGWWLLLPILSLNFFFFTIMTNTSIILINMSTALVIVSSLFLLFCFISPGTKDKNRFG
tara:strand:- start:3679 stop:4161 length:483 start_codon:yes stop_codon:yes gene_type:complete